MENANASSLDQSPVSENQEKLVDIYFGVFFDAMDTSVAAQYFNQAEYLRKGEEAISDVKENSIYKAVDEYSGYVGSIASQLPNNPVSNAVNAALGAKDMIESKVDGLMGKVEGLGNSITGLADRLPTSIGTGGDDKEDGEKREELVGSRSIISKMEPCYIGDYYGTNYNFRIYTVGAVTNNEVKRPQDDPDFDDNVREGFEKKGIDKAMDAITNQINASPPKQSVHFDIFGYSKDPAVKNFIPKIDEFKQNQNVTEISIEHKGLYDKFYDFNEVASSLGETMLHFRNLNKLK